MNIFPSFKYQFKIQKSMVLIYYLVYVGLSVLLTALFVITPIAAGDPDVQAGTVTLNGLTSSTLILAFVAGCCAFKENFGMAVQNGVSRKSLFFGRLCATGALCFLLAVCDEVLTLLFDLIGRLPALSWSSVSLLEMAYGPVGGSWLLTALCAVPFSFFLLLAASAVGYFCTTLFYRLPTWGKAAVAVSFGVLFIFGVPVLKMLRDAFHLEALWDALCRLLTELGRLCFGGAVNWMVTGFVIFCAFSAFAWLLIRRAELKK